MWWRTLVAIAVGLMALWLAMVVLLWRAQRHAPDKARLRDAVRLVPDVVRLLRRLGGDRTLPRSVRFRMWLLLIYLISPIDLIPDFIPVLGYADDAIIVAIALSARSPAEQDLRPSNNTGQELPKASPPSSFSLALDPPKDTHRPSARCDTSDSHLQI